VFTYGGDVGPDEQWRVITVVYQRVPVVVE